ncbi:MAG: serine hydrolase [Candidatus Omnitrophota bacterium]
MGKGIVVILLILAAVGCEREARLDINARTAVIVNARTGRLIYKKNVNEKFPPASTSKIMTAIVAIENLALDEKVIPSKNITKVEPTAAPLNPGVEYVLKDLIYAMLVKSANDAALAVAEGVSGSEVKFVELMNEKARGINMRNTYFANASGLPTGIKDNQYTTAEDLAKMMRYALRYGIILDAVSKKEENIRGSDGKNIHLRTHNNTLFREGGEAWGKTGYTKEAKRTFVGVDPSSEPKIIFALLQSDDLWNDIVKLKEYGLKASKRNRFLPFL